MGLFQMQIESETPEIAEIPCIFPDQQGIGLREHFASDCVIRQSRTGTAKASTHRNNDFPFSASTFDVG